MPTDTPTQRSRFWPTLLLVPNLLCLLRLFLVGVTWAFALAAMPRLVAVGIVAAGVTDVLDGPIARRTRTSSRLGSALDSLADLSLAGSTFWWLVMLRPEFFRANSLPLVAWAVVGILVLGVGWLRFGRIGDLHLYSAKVAGPVAYFWAVCLLAWEGADVRLFYAAVVVAFAAQGEMLYAFLTRERVDEHAGSVLLPTRAASSPSGRDADRPA